MAPAQRKSPHRNTNKSHGGTAPKIHAAQKSHLEAPLTQAIILAAGKSTRTWPLTISRPKALLEVANKTILEHNLEQLQGIIKDAVIVTGFEGTNAVVKVSTINCLLSTLYSKSIARLKIYYLFSS